MDKDTHKIEEIFTNLQRIRHGSIHKHSKKSKHHLPFSQMRILFSLEDGEMQNSKLAEELGVSPSASTQFIRPLEERGLVSRKSSVEDRRAIHLELTRKGKDCIDDLRKRRSAHMYQMLEVLSPEELDQLAAITSKLASTMHEDK